MEIHPAASLFPMMDSEELGLLAADIRANGLRDPVELTEDGLVLDGRNRMAACKLAKVEPAFKTVIVDDPIAYVVSKNVMRRNLTKQQKAIAAAESWEMYGGPPDRKGGRPRTSDQSEVMNGDKLAAMWGVGRDYLTWATALVYEWPEAAADVKAGIASLPGSYERLQEEKREQSSGSEEIKRLERELDLLRKKEMEPLDRAHLLPPPTDSEIEVATSLSRLTLTKESSPTQPSDSAAELKKQIAWKTALVEANAVMKKIRELPTFPDVNDSSLTAIMATEIVLMMGDAAKRIINALPAEEAKLRRIK